MRIAVFIPLLFVLSCSICLGQTDDTSVSDENAVKVGQLSQSSIVDASIREKLNEPVNIHFKEHPWREIEQLLEKTHGFNIVLTRSAIDDSLGDDEPVTFQLQGASLKTAIRLMLRSKNATYIVQDNVLKIISLDDELSPAYFTNRFINVRSLIKRITELEQNRIKNTRPAGGATAESILIDLIQESVSPDQWRNTGNGDATIQIIGGYAVVNCQDSLADSLGDFLQDLSFHLSSK